MKPSHSRFKATRVTIQKIDNGFILKFLAIQAISALTLDYDWNSRRTEIYSTEEQLHQRLSELFREGE